MATEQPAALRGSATPVEALNHLSELIISYAQSQALAAAVKLGVMEELGKGPATPEEIAARVNIHPQGCRRLLMALCDLGLAEGDAGRFRTSPIGQYCSSQSPVNLARIIGFIEPFCHMFEYLSDALREYSPRWQQALGTSQADVFGAL